MLCGSAILGAASEPFWTVLRWVMQAVVVTSLVFYASATYRRLRMRESRPPDAHEVAAARVRASEAAVAARDEFLAVAAHELRTPLTSMLLHIEAIERTLPAETAAEATMHVPPTEQKRIAAVARQARRLSGLIDSMLDVSKLTGGHLSLELAEIDVAALVREVVQRFTPDAAAAACPLTLRLDQPGEGRARCDAPRSDRHQPDRQRAQIRGGRPGRDRGGGRRDGDPADRARPRHRHLARRPAAHLSPLRTRRRRAAIFGGRASGSGSPASWSRRWAAASPSHSSPGAGASFTVVLPRRPTTLIERRRSGAAARPATAKPVFLL